MRPDHGESGGTGRLDCAGIWTGSGAPLPATAVHFRDGRITGMEPLAGTAPPVFVIPSFVDAHCHLSWIGLQEAVPDLGGVRSASEMLDIIDRQARLTPSGGMLRAEKWDDGNWVDPELPLLTELDAASGGRPAIIRRVCGHMVLVTSALMELLPENCPGLDRETGRILEGVALEMDKLFPPSAELLLKAAAAAERMVLSSGVTAVQTMEPAFLARSESSRGFSIEVAVAIFHRDIGEWTNSFEEEGMTGQKFRVNGMKLFLDGAFGAGTAAIDGCYVDGSTAVPLYDDSGLEEAFREASSRGLVPMVHAIGSKSLRLLDRVSTRLARQEPEIMRLGVRVEHAEDLLPAWPGTWDPSIHRFSMQPNFVSRWQGQAGLYQRKLGASRSHDLNPFGLIHRGGFMLGFGSDGMPFGPLVGLAGATGHPVPEYRLELTDALYAYTLGAAAVSGFRELSLPLGTGRKADFTVLSADPFMDPLEEIDVVATVMEGRVAFGPEETVESTDGVLQ